MPSKPKTLRRETSVIERAAIWAYYLDGLSYSKVAVIVKVPKSTIATIV